MAVDMFIKIGDVSGEAVDHAHKGEIDVLSWGWGMSQSGTMHHGGGGGSGKVSVQDLSFTKFIDKATTVLNLACCNGTHYDEATLVVRKAGGKSQIEYVTIVMKDVLITSISTGGSGGEDRLTENVTLNFGKFEYKYQPQKKDGSKDGGELKMTWNIETNNEKH